MMRETFNDSFLPSHPQASPALANLRLRDKAQTYVPAVEIPECNYQQLVVPSS